MAIIKHISFKNADYGAAERYLLYEHDEFTMKPILDGKGHFFLRENFCITTLNCDNEDFAISCIRANKKYGKNNRQGDVKSHHYIISFDPRDRTDHGLTIDKAQRLGLDYCKKYFPGHQALICTHSDGHNHSGNIHVHIIINSLRVQNVEHKSYMDRRCDTQAGAKHRCTAAAFRYFRSGVMEMCHRYGYYQIDLLNGSRNKISDNEYWAKKRGQEELNQINRENAKESLSFRQTKFETDKEQLRQIIQDVLFTAISFEDFSAKLMQNYGIVVRESRGRYSYLTPERSKPISARKLGKDYDKEMANVIFNQNTDRICQLSGHSYQTIKGIKELIKKEKEKKNIIKKDKMLNSTERIVRSEKER